jgi:hypothetical protein
MNLAVVSSSQSTSGGLHFLMLNELSALRDRNAEEDPAVILTACHRVGHSLLAPNPKLDADFF